MLELLKLQRLLYSKAKKVQYISVLVIFIITISFLIINHFFTNDVLWIYSVVFAAIAFIAQFIIDFIVSSEKKTAAGIQQKYDHCVLGVQLNYPGWYIPDNETLANLGIKYKQKTLPNLENWYSDYSNLPEKQQILRCQSENIRWDAELRGKMLWIVTILTAILVLVAILLAIPFKSVYQMVAIFTWIAPILKYSISTVVNLYKDRKQLDVLAIELKDIQNIPDPEAKKKADDIQLLIWQHRSKCFLIPDFIYKKDRGTRQQTEDLIACTYNKSSNKEQDDEGGNK